MFQVPPTKTVPFSSPGFVGSHCRQMCSSYTVKQQHIRIWHETFVAAKRGLSIQPRPKLPRLNKSACHDPSKAQTRDAQLEIASFVGDVLESMVLSRTS